MNCSDWPTEALQKVYGGELCQYHGHELPMTGMNILDFVIVAAMLLVVGLYLRKGGRNA